MLNSVNRFIVYLLVVCSVGLGLPLPAPAGIIGTDQLVAGGERDRVKSFLTGMTFAPNCRRKASTLPPRRRVWML